MKIRVQLMARTTVVLVAMTALLTVGFSIPAVQAQTRVSVGVTETMETFNPYGDSVSLLYGIWSEVTGPFCTYNYTKGGLRDGWRSAGRSRTPTPGCSIWTRGISSTTARQ